MDTSSSTGTLPTYIVEFVDLVSAALDTPSLDGMLSLNDAQAVPSPDQTQSRSLVCQMLDKFKKFAKKSSSSTRLAVRRRAMAPENQMPELRAASRRALTSHIVFIDRVSIVSPATQHSYDRKCTTSALASSDQSRVLYRAKSLPGIPQDAESSFGTPSMSSCSSGFSSESRHMTSLTCISEKLNSGDGGGWPVYSPSDFGPLPPDPFAKSELSPDILPPEPTRSHPYLLGSSFSNPNFHAPGNSTEEWPHGRLRRHRSMRFPPTPPPAYPIPPVPHHRNNISAPRPCNLPSRLPPSPKPLPRTNSRQSLSQAGSQSRRFAPLDASLNLPTLPGTTPSLRAATAALPPMKAHRPSSPFPFTRRLKSE